jgi:hypothetical protein
MSKKHKSKSGSAGSRPAPSSGDSAATSPAAEAAIAATLRFGWLAVAVFMIGGLALEALHLFKLPLYLDVHIRRELWTLGHAHGTLMGVVTIAMGLTMRARVASPDGRQPGRLGRLVGASQALRAAAVLLPAGFLLGGVGNAEGDPSLFIGLVPIGAVLAIYAAFTTAATLRSE